MCNIETLFGEFGCNESLGRPSSLWIWEIYRTAITKPSGHLTLSYREGGLLLPFGSIRQTVYVVFDEKLGAI